MSDLSKKAIWLSARAKMLAIDAERISDKLNEAGTPLWDIAHLIAAILWKYGEMHQEVIKRMGKYDTNKK